MDATDNQKTKTPDHHELHDRFTGDDGALQESTIAASEEWNQDTDGWLRAEAWPTTDMESPWLALEEGEGAFRATSTTTPARFVFTSRRESMPAKGVVIDIPADAVLGQRPAWVDVRVSATPIKITRSAWPSIQPLLHSVGVGEIPVTSQQSLYLQFPDIERVSILEVRIWLHDENQHVHVGKFKLVHQRTPVPSASVLTIPLAFSNESMLPSEKSGIFGVDDELSLPHR